jgi:hypothetical protein
MSCAVIDHANTTDLEGSAPVQDAGAFVQNNQVCGVGRGEKIAY